jgi:hypothetical protein
MRKDVREKAESDDPKTFLADCESSYDHGCGEKDSVLFRLGYAEYDYLRYFGECDECGTEFILDYEFEKMEMIAE